jgi:hypothetical protein
MGRGVIQAYEATSHGHLSQTNSQYWDIVSMRISNIKRKRRRISNIQKRGRGRPPTGATAIGLRLPPDQLAALDTWIAGQKGKPGRPEAIRRLLAVQLARRQPKVLHPASSRLTPKRRGAGLESKTIVGSSGTPYVVIRSGSGSFHVLAEVETEEAARDCGAREGRNTRSQWKALWDAK